MWEGFWFFLFLAVEKSSRLRSDECWGSRLLISVQRLVAVWKGGVMLEVFASIPKLNRFLQADAVTLSSCVFALGVGNHWQLRRGCNSFCWSRSWAIVFFLYMNLYFKVHPGLIKQMLFLKHINQAGCQLDFPRRIFIFSDWKDLFSVYIYEIWQQLMEVEKSAIFFYSR